jgi:hypothetical protein
MAEPTLCREDEPDDSSHGCALLCVGVVFRVDLILHCHDPHLAWAELASRLNFIVMERRASDWLADAGTFGRWNIKGRQASWRRSRHFPGVTCSNRSWALGVSHYSWVVIVAQSESAGGAPLLAVSEESSKHWRNVGPR